jgi:general secretion pathway protein D
MSPNTLRGALLAAVSILSSPALLKAGSMGDGSYPGPIEGSEREITRRQEDMLLAEQAIKAGDAARARKEPQAAYDYYKQAVDMVPQGSAGGSLRARAVTQFSRGAVEYAKYLVSRGEYAEARRVASEILEPRYNPDYRPAIEFLSHLEQADYFNKTITPEFAAQRDEVNKLMTEAVGFYDSGRYDMAQKRYREILAIDGDNAAAFRGLEQVELGKQRYYESAYNETRSRMLWQVDKAWQRPHKLPENEAGMELPEIATEKAGTERTMSILNSIIVPEVNLSDATLQQAVRYLREESQRLSPPDAPDGINIVLKLPSAPARPISDDADTTGSVAPSFNDQITLKLRNIPLYEALRYVARLAGLKIKVEPFAVTIGTEGDAMQRKMFRVPPAFFAEANSGASAEGETFAGRQPGDSARPAGRAPINAIEFLKTKGVTFDQGSSASYNVATGSLAVVNTPSNLDLIESLVEAVTASEPRQIKIETKFVEVSQNNLKELGFDWNLGPFSIGGSGVYGGGGDAVSTGREFPFINPATGLPIGDNSLTGGLRTGRGTADYSALSVNSINALLAQSFGLPIQSAPAPGVFSIAGIFSNPQFQVMIRALNQKKGIDLMAAPSVTTQSGKKATVTISRIFYYPTEFTPPEIPQSTGGGSVNVGGVVQEQDPIVTPSFPTAFTTRDLGVTLNVEPTIGADGYTIDMNLAPEVVDFEGFINYGSPIFAPQRVNLLVATNSLIAVPSLFRQQLLTENVINQPIFSKRKVESSVTVWDGQTVVLGGLIREDVQKISDKVPILGDIPLAGALFRSEVEQKIKRNLIIFCTPRIIDAAGQPLSPEEDISDDLELVQPLGLPPEVPLPARGNPKGLTRK